MLKTLFLIRCILLCAMVAPLAICQDPSASPSKAPLDHVLGTITAVDKTAQTVTVQEDKTSTVHVIQLANTKTLLKVEPTAKDLKSAVRITAADLEVGDRVDVRGSKTEDSQTTMNAKSVILMSGRALAMTHEEQAAAWAKATSGKVTAIDAATGKITADAKVEGETKSITVQTAPGTEFTRYSPESGKPAPSQLAQIQVGDQLKVIGDKNDDGSSISGSKVYTGAFRTISVTISAIGADGKTLTAKDLATKKDVTITLNTEAAIHKLPPMMAAMLARRLNPAAAGAAGAGGPPNGGVPANASAGGPPAGGGMPGGTGGYGGAPGGYGGAPGGYGGGPGAGAGRGNGDMSSMLERTPKVQLSELKVGDALVISGVATSSDNSKLLANTIIAGVEPILQSAPTQRGGRSVGGDWGLGEMSAPQ